MENLLKVVCFGLVIHTKKWGGVITKILELLLVWVIWYIIRNGIPPKTKIWIGLKDDNLDIDFRVTYESKELEEWADKIKEEKAKSNF